MLTAVTKVLSLIAGLHGESEDSYSSESETESSASDDNDAPPPSHLGKAAEQDRKEVSLEWNFSGVVTQFSHNCGLVDDTVYFSRGVVQGSEVKLGSPVQVTAKRSSLTAGWCAEVVTLITLGGWEEEEESGMTGPTVGMVTDVTHNTVVIDYVCTVNMDGTVHGYRPCKGDWVKAETSEDGTVQVEPLRSQVITGKVSQVRGDTGVVDGEVLFWPQVCVDGYIPSRGDWVEVTAIESTQGHYSWRATIVTPLKRPPRDRFPNKLKSWQKQKVQDGWVVPGQSPFRRKPVRFPVHLPQYPVPDMLRNCVFEGRDVKKIMPVLCKPLTMTDYARRWSCLLHLEELQMEMDIHEFDMINESLQPCGEYLSLTVPGLAEGRPSVLIGDKVVLTAPGAGDCSPCYEGYVHEVLREEVLLKFHQDFHSSYDGEPYNVFFMFNRSTLRRCHQAANFAHNLGCQVLFPSQPTLSPPLVNCQPDRTNTQLAAGKRNHSGAQQNKGGRFPGASLQLFNPRLNQQQQAAVTRILRAEARPAPYVLFGPPGTGKTVTLVEAILQVFHNLPYSRIVACTPSNSAADLLAERLHKSGQVKQADMVRLNAFQRVQEIPESIERYCMDGDQLEQVSRRRIIVATCSTAGLLYSLGLRSGHFTHVFVDEAGQATEPECMIPVGLCAGAQSQVVLSGDPMQLGPVLQSHLAKDLGLGQSLLERLMTSGPYLRDSSRFSQHAAYNPLLVTKLVCNYRSHPALLKLPSQLFYHGDLFTLADPSLTRQLEDWEGLPCKGCPIVFHGTEGEDMREGSSPSWFNPVEAVQVLRYTQLLLGGSVKQADLGIITPYRKQVEKLRLLLGSVGLDEVKVGSVEEFQGQERLIIIISTVRSTTNMLKFDTVHTLGFLSNPKRFNVSITRAQALLIMVGNPHVLGQDPYWLSLLQYCVDQGAYTGCSLPPTVKVKADSSSSTSDVQHTESSSSLPTTNDAPSNQLDKESQMTEPLAPQFIADTQLSSLDRDRDQCYHNISSHEMNIPERGNDIAHSEEMTEARLGGWKMKKDMIRYDKNTSNQPPGALVVENQVTEKGKDANNVKPANKDSVVADVKSEGHYGTNVKQADVRKKEDTSSDCLVPELANTIIQNSNNLLNDGASKLPIMSVQTMEKGGMNTDVHVDVSDCLGTCETVCDNCSMPSLSDGESDQHDSDVIVESSYEESGEER
ncbi:MOV10L1 [Branchiostoma lanceolatum]|uniref:RNA helicase n=1 Tax=Branchiostoma lanceolatum TaxID=7740 RepID=A0A8J9ZYL5_BRALA|nr:MOV10L1 [Branchiostoma lanceolatum]